MLAVDIKKKTGSFSLEASFETEGGALALMGASGSGKSMTLRCIAGLLRPDSGRIVLNGRVLFDSERNIDLPPQKRGAGYLFQQYALFPHMTVAGNIAAGARRLGKKDRLEAVSQMVERFRLAGLEERYPAHLSGGERQRVALGRIFAGQPALLLLDEPFAALDSHLKWQLELELMDALASFGGDVIYVSHDRDEICHLCRRVCVLTDGRSEPVVGVEEWMTRPGTVSAALLSGCKNYSRAVRTAEHTLRCEDWGVSLQTAAAVGKEITAAAVRERDWTLGPGTENNVPCTVARVIEDGHAVTVVLRTPGGGVLRLELDREEWTGLGRPRELTVHVAPKCVLALTGGDVCKT